MTTRRRFLRLCGVAGGGSLAGCSYFSQDEDRGPYHLGSSVAIPEDDTTAFVGAYGIEEKFVDDDNDIQSQNSGRVSVFDTTAGASTRENRIPTDDVYYGKFGKSLAVSNDGTTALIGAPRSEDSSSALKGTAYVFTATDGSWTKQAKFTADDGLRNKNRFGAAVALSSDGTTAVVGHAHDDTNPSATGAVSVFDTTDGSWARQEKFVAREVESDDYAGGEFGTAVALSRDGTTALVGANIRRESDAGVAYVFDLVDGSWNRRVRLTGDYGDDYDDRGANFGHSVALSGDGTIALVGDPENGLPNQPVTGTASVFEFIDGSWTQRDRLTAGDPEETDRFGQSVALAGDGTTALVGAPGEAPSGRGSAYVFDAGGDSWTQQAKLTPNKVNGHNLFGGAVAMSEDGTTTLVGAKDDNDHRGSAYVFDAAGESWTQRTKLTRDTGGFFG